MSDSQSLSRLNTRLLLESSRTFLEAKDPHFIARNISLVVMGKFMISRAAVAVKQENSKGKSGDDGGGSGYKFLFIRGASPYSEGEFLPDDSVSLCFQSTTESSSSTKNELRIFNEDQIHHVCFRIGSESDALGVLILGLSNPQTSLTEEASEWVEQICNLGAVALKNGLLIQELKEVNRELDRKVVDLKTLFEIAKEFNSLLSRDQISSLFKYTLMGQLLMNKAFLAVKTEKGFEVVTSIGLQRSPSQEEMAELSATETVQKETPLLQDLGLHLCMKVNQENSALVGLGPKLDHKEYTNADLQLVESIANLTLLSTEKTHLLDEMIEKKRMAEELSIARTIQQGLIPHEIPIFDSLDIALLNIPSREVGGDYVDFAQSPDGNLIFAIADVSGKGVPAALLMANLQAMLHVLLPVDISLSEAVERINNLLVQHTPEDKFVTFFLAKYYRDERKFCYVNAGHNPGYLLRSDTNRIEELNTGGILLGALPTFAPYETGEILLKKGDQILLYTDGFTETFNSDKTKEFGEARLQASFIAHRDEKAEDLLKYLLKDVEAFGDPRASDDLTALSIQILR